MAKLVVVNQSKLVSDAEAQAYLPTLQTQIERDFTPVWGVTGELHWASGPSDAWVFYMQDGGLDAPGDLGYHLDESGRVLARIDVQACVSCGGDWRTVLGHEVLETLADPLASRMAPNGSDIIEVCDPVEGTGYEIGGLPVTNFVLPSYFGWWPNGPWDFNGQLTGPSPRVLPGGYRMFLLAGRWQSEFGERGAEGFMAKRENGRRGFRRARVVPE